MNDDFLEKRLRELPRREVPPEWCTEILSAAASAKPRRSVTWLPSFVALKSLLWPHPYAWAGLAAVWVVIAGLNFSGPRGEALYAVTPANAKPMEITTERYVAYLRQTKLFLAQSDQPTPFFKPIEPRKL